MVHVIWCIFIGNKIYYAIYAGVSFLLNSFIIDVQKDLMKTWGPLAPIKLPVAMHFSHQFRADLFSKKLMIKEILICKVKYVYFQ